MASPLVLLRRPLPSTYRMLLWSVVIGVAGALVVIAFRALVEEAKEWLLVGIGRWEPLAAPLGLTDRSRTWLDRAWLPVATTLGALLSGLLVYRLAPEAEGHGTDAAIEAFHREGGSQRARVPLIKAISSALIIGSGGVAGEQGPAAQITSGVGALVARAAGLRGLERRTLSLAAMAAGLAAIFRAPLGMAIFATEILYSGMAFEGEALIYTVVAAVTAYAVYGSFMGWAPFFDFPAIRFDSPSALPAFVVLGVLAGLLGAVLPYLLYRSKGFFERLPGPPHWKPAAAGLLLGLVAMWAPEVLGAGYEWVEAGVAGRLTAGAALLILLMKAPGMALTIGSGGSGGVFGPTISMGGLLGAALGATLVERGLAGDMPVAGFIVVGMAAVFAGAGRTPISTLIMVVEMTRGYGLIVPTMLATIVAFLVQRGVTQGRRFATLYPSQVESPGPVLVRVDVEPGSRLDGATIGEAVGTIEGATAVAIERGEETIVPRGGTELRAGDRLLAVVTGPAHQRILAAAAGR